MVARMTTPFQSRLDATSHPASAGFCFLDREPGSSRPYANLAPCSLSSARSTERWQRDSNSQ